jgi:hypothetical protein
MIDGIRARALARGMTCGLAVVLAMANLALAGGRPPIPIAPTLTGRSVYGLAPPMGTYRSLFPVRDEGDKGGNEAEDQDGPSDRSQRILGCSLLASGLFLCSWGISSWEISEYQCCPARNTYNVVKIVSGVVLLNAGLVYLLDVDD